MNNIKLKEKGFTLVELIVVIAVFMLIVGVAIAILLSIIQNQRRILAQEQMLDQVSYAMEYMSKGLRMAKKDSTGSCLYYVDDAYIITEHFSGYVYLFTKPIGENYTGIKFINQSNNDACQEFYLDSTGENGVVKELQNQVDKDYSTALTSNQFNVDYLKFGVNGNIGLAGGESHGASENDTQQPRVTVIMGFQLPEDTSQPEIKIQTTVSQRNLNAK